MSQPRWRRVLSLIELVSCVCRQPASRESRRRSVRFQVPLVVLLEQLWIAVVLEHAERDGRRTFQLGGINVIMTGTLDSCQRRMQGQLSLQQNLVKTYAVHVYKHAAVDDWAAMGCTDATVKARMQGCTTASASYGLDLLTY